MKSIYAFISILIIFILFTKCSEKNNNQAVETNYDESKVLVFTLPDPLELPNGEKVKTAEEWENRRRSEVLSLFETEMYGKFPQGAIDVYFEPLEESQNALNGTAVRKQIRAHFLGNGRELHMDILIYLPKQAIRPVQLFTGMNFFGNHVTNNDPDIIISDAWVQNWSFLGIEHHSASEVKRGALAYRWPVKEILKRGYGLATMCYNDLDPDFDDGFQNGIHPLFYDDGQTKPANNEWGAIGAWSWGLSRAMDYFETDPDIDQSKIAIVGHSRLGKTALWTGAADQRFALVFSNDSGCGGAALSKRRFGETVAILNAAAPHWFCENYKKYNDNEDKLPFDQHMLIALIAPRPVYIASAKEDLGADPQGEFLSGKYASPVYGLYGLEGLPADQMPPVNQQVMGTIGYHIRSGTHDMTIFDWEQYLNFADKHFR